MKHVLSSLNILDCASFCDADDCPFANLTDNCLSYTNFVHENADVFRRTAIGL